MELILPDHEAWLQARREGIGASDARSPPRHEPLQDQRPALGGEGRPACSRGHQRQAIRPVRPRRRAAPPGTLRPGPSGAGGEIRLAIQDHPERRPSLHPGEPRRRAGRAQHRTKRRPRNQDDRDQGADSMERMGRPNPRDLLLPGSLADARHRLGVRVAESPDQVVSERRASPRHTRIPHREGRGPGRPRQLPWKPESTSGSTFKKRKDRHSNCRRYKEETPC